MKFALVCLFLSAVAWAQVDGITVTATKMLEFAPEEAAFSIVLLTEQETSLDDAVLALKSIGIESKHLVSLGTQMMYGPGAPSNRNAYQFVLTVRYAAMKETTEKIAAIRRNFLAENSKNEIQIAGTTIGPSAATIDKVRQDSLAELIADARRRAEVLAKAAGLTLGRILSAGEPFIGYGVGAVPGPYYYGGPSMLRSSVALTVRFAAE